jgi:hypothetical protein
MIGKIWNALAIVRHAVAITIVLGAAGATVASSVDASSRGTQVAHTATAASAVVSASEAKNVTTSELEELVKACLTTKDPATRECATAVDASGLSSEMFWARVAMSLNEQLVKAKSEPSAKTEPKTEQPKTEQPNDESLSLLVKDCLLKYAALKTNTEAASEASEACRKAIAASGLTSADFWARFGPKTAPTTKPEPTKKPETTKRPETAGASTAVTTAQIEVLVKDCFTKYLIAKNTKVGSTAAVEACNKAMAASGLTGTAFWAKFGTPGSN